MEIVRGLLGMFGLWIPLAFWVWFFQGNVTTFTIIYVAVILGVIFIAYLIGSSSSGNSKGLPGTYESENTTPPKQRSLEQRELELRERELAVREKAVAEAEKGKKVPLAVKTATAGVVGYKIGKKIGKW